jgi:general secretion pathway protein I
MVILLLKIPHRNCGFTLLEIMIALAILAITMTTLLLSTSQVARNSRYLRDKTFASIVASNIINSARFGTINLSSKESSTSGTQTQAGNLYHWRLSSHNTSDPFTQKLIVDVTFDKNATPLISMIGYRPVLQP